MKKVLVNKIKKQLEDERDAILSKPKVEIIIDIDGDEVDQIQGKILVAANDQLIARDKEKLAKIKIALEKIEDGEYGDCEECGDSIAEKRLLFNPSFNLCISCAEAKEIFKNK
jgi:DnaK suppressor protein